MGGIHVEEIMALAVVAAEIFSEATEEERKKSLEVAKEMGRCLHGHDYKTAAMAIVGLAGSLVDYAMKNLEELN